jgi:hypothetical protein
LPPRITMSACIGRPSIGEHFTSASITPPFSTLLGCVPLIDEVRITAKPQYDF